MVRVIQAHNFKSQITQNISDEVHCCELIGSEHILIGRADGCIELYKLDRTHEDTLEDGMDSVHTFNTVGDLKKMIYCSTGHYIATIETNGMTVARSVRIYINWDAAFNSTTSNDEKTTPQMRARVASRVTPTMNDSDKNGFEMIELPLRCRDSWPVDIACCQMTGNVAISQNNKLIVFYKFFYCKKYERLAYIDFEEMCFYVQLEYVTEKITLSENIIVAYNEKYLNAFKVTEDVSDITEDISDNCVYDKISPPNLSQNISYNDLFKYNGTNNYGRIIIHGSSNQEQMNNNQMRSNKERDANEATNNITGPQLCQSSEAKVIIFAWDEKVDLKWGISSILALKISADQCTNGDLLKQFSIKPMYLKLRENVDSNDAVDASLNSNSTTYSNSFTNDTNELRSTYYREFLGCGLIVTTSEDGYLYFLEKGKRIKRDSKDLLETYSFTASLTDIILDDTLVYAVTNVGLEIYTSKIGHHLLGCLMDESSSIVKAPNMDFPVCSIDMRPFLGLKKAYVSGKKLVLLSDRSENWTLYNLELPSPVELETEINRIALEQRAECLYNSPNSYTEHLLGEAYVLIRMVKELGSKIETNDLTKLSSTVSDDVTQAHKQACTNLGNYFITKPDAKNYMQAYTYYKMGHVDVATVLDQIINQTPLSVAGYVYTLKQMLRDITRSTAGIQISSPIKIVPTLDQMLDVMINVMPNEVSRFALHSSMLREELRDKIFNFLLIKTERNIEDEICLLIYQIQSSDEVIIPEAINKSTKTELYNIILPNWIIYFDTITSKYGNRVTSFSDFAEYCITNERVDNDMMSEPESKVALMSEVFLSILIRLVVTERIIKLDLIVRLFTDFITSNIGTRRCQNGQRMLKTLLEKFFIDYFEVNRAGSTSVDDHNLRSPVLSEVSDTSDSSSLSSFSVTSKNHKVSYSSKYFIDSLLILLRIYLDEWRKVNDSISPLMKIDQLPQNIVLQKNAFTANNFNLGFFKEHEIVSFGRRYIYLNMIWPFFGNANDGDGGETALFKLKVILAKIQSLLCSELISKKVIDEVHRFINSHKSLYGAESVFSCMMESLDACDCLIDTAPQCLHILAQERFKSNEDWQSLVTIFTRKLEELHNYHEKKAYYLELFKELLNYIVSIKEHKDVQEIFPKCSILDVLQTQRYEEEYYIGDSKSETTIKFDHLFIEYLHKSFNKKLCEKPKIVIANTVRGTLQMDQSSQNGL